MCSLMDIDDEKVKQLVQENLIRDRLLVVEDELRKYKQKLSDAEWEGLDEEEVIIPLRKSVQHYEMLQGKGILYEPTF